MPDSNNYSALEILHQNESFIYEEFATESIDNIHVKSIDLKRPLSSILRVALSDIISSQILASKTGSNFHLRVYPTFLYALDRKTKRYSQIKLNNNKNCLIKNELLRFHDNEVETADNFREKLFNGGLLDACAINYKFSDEFVQDCIEKIKISNKNKTERCFHNWYSHTKFEKENKDENVGYDVIIFYNVYKVGSITEIIDNTTNDNFIDSFLKKIVVLAISTKRNKEFYRRIKSTTLKSSLAAVMSRNMSHNIGSHVLNKLSSAAAIQDFFRLTKQYTYVKALRLGEFHKLKAEKESTSLFIDTLGGNNPKTDERFIYIDFSNEIITKKEQSNYDFVTFDAKEVKEAKKEVEIGEEQIVGYNITPIYKLSPYFVDVNNNTTKEELARVFNDYLKKRMDFVADVATSNKALLNSNKYLFADIFRGFERNLLLLQNISGKEDKFSYQFQFQYCDGDKTSNYYHYDDNYNLRLKNGVPVKNKDFIDPIVAVPNDVLGSQAFYIILENIIRNTAKHSGSGNVVFTIKVEDLKEDDFYRVTVFDNVAFNGENNEEKANKLKKLVADRNISIAQEVLDENNQIRTAGWGTIEIKLAACYLSGLDMLEMDNKMYWPVGYPAYEKAKEVAEKFVVSDESWLKYNKKNTKCTKEEYVKNESVNAYITFLKHEDECNEQNEEYSIPVEGLKSTQNVRECAKKLVRTFKNKEKKTITRYPIVQAVDGDEKDDTKGFGYSFLMKKPKKLLIVDESGALKLETKDKEGKNISHEDNVIALKRLGIDIIKAPQRDSIYNHKFMIIVGDENSEHYGDWFNLPQERFRYFEEQYQNYKFSLNKFKLTGNTLQNADFNTVLNLTIAKSNTKKYPYLDYLFDIINGCYSIKIKKREPVLYPIMQDPFRYRNNGKNNYAAYFKHHGLKYETFYDNSTRYAEIFGSVTPLGLLRDSLNSQIGDNKDLKKSLQKEYSYFFTLAANTSVIVIDERIQSTLNEIGVTTEAIVDEKGNIEEDGFSIKNINLFKKTRIFVPDTHNDNISLNYSDLTKQKSQLKNYIESLSENEKADYLIIHFGIIESLRENNEVQDVLSEVKSWIKSGHCKLVITSGRGHTPDIKELNQYFVAYSTISNLLLDPNGRSKGHLMNCLKQLRIIKK